MKMPLLLIRLKIVLKNLLIKKGGCFEYHAVIADKIKYRYVHRASICPALGMDRRSFYAQSHGQIQEEVFYLSKPVYAADKPNDCHYCHFWANGRKGCRLGRNNCYYLISLPPKPKSECDGCPYTRQSSALPSILRRLPHSPARTDPGATAPEQAPLPPPGTGIPAPARQ